MDVIGNNEYEDTIIGVLVMSESFGMYDMVQTITAQLDASDLRQIQAQRIYRVVIDLLQQKTEINAITVANQALPDDKPYLMTCITLPHLTNVVNVQHYIDTIKDYALRRLIANTASNVLQEAVQATVTTSSLLQTMKSIDVPEDETDLFNMASMIDGIYKDIENGTQSGIPYHLPKLTKYTNGKGASEFIIIGGRPGEGKSSFLLADAMYSASKGASVLYCTLEISAKQVTRNALSQESGIPVPVLKSNTLTRDQWKRLHKAGETIYKRPPVIYDKSGMGIVDIERKIQQLNPDIVYIDYLQLMRDASYASLGRTQELAHISRRIKELAKGYNIPIVAGAQLNRDGAGKPELRHLKESGSLEQDADSVILIHSLLDENVPEHYTRTPTILHLAKNREGQTGHIKVTFNRPRLRFEELASS